MTDPRLSAVAPADLAALTALNEAAVPAVNSVPVEFFRAMQPASECFMAAHVDGQLAGFLLLLPGGVDYDSLNYRWFSRRYADFLYVDRVVVAAGARRRGLGRAFYDSAWGRATARGVALTCEVNVAPPNPDSMAFHRSFGFREVGRQQTEGGAKTVSLMTREPGA